VIPCHRTPPSHVKTPCVRWRRYTHVRASLATVRGWIRQFEHHNPAVITGRISGLVVIDCDSAEAVQRFLDLAPPITPRVKTRRGEHWYFRAPDFTVSTLHGTLPDFPGICVLGEGGYVLAPHAVGGDGTPYLWLVPPSVPLASLPVEIVAALKERAESVGGRAGASGSTTAGMGGAGGRGQTPRGEWGPYGTIWRSYGLAALTGELSRLRAIPLEEGNNKESRMIQSAYRLGQLIGGECLDRATVERELLAIWCERWNKPRERGERTIQRGVTDGIARPRTYPTDSHRGATDALPPRSP